MKLNSDDILIMERNEIAKNFCVPLEINWRGPADIAVHKQQIEAVYKGMLREVKVVADCCYRFGKMFRWN